MVAIPQSWVSRIMGIETEFVDNGGNAAAFLPQRIAVFGQGASASTYALTKARFFSALAVGQTYGFGSPLHLIALQMLPVNGDGIGAIPMTIYPMEDDGSGVAAAGDITPTMTPTRSEAYQIVINNIASKAFVLEVGDVVADFITKAIAAVNAEPNMPMIAANGTTLLDLTAKWAGVSSNGLRIEIVGATDAGNTFVITQPVGGLINPTVDAGLAQVGDVWESLVMNALDIEDTTALTTFSDWGEGRWLPTIKKPAVVFTGTTEADVLTAIVIPESRKTDRTNCQLVEPGSADLPFVSAARQLARIAKVANSNPPVDYARQRATGLVPGTDAQQWTPTQMEAAVNGGSSTTKLVDNVVNLSDTITFYHPTGEQNPGYRYVVDIIKLQNTIFNIALIFENAKWDAAPLAADDEPTTNPATKKAKNATSAVAQTVGNLGLVTILTDTKTTIPLIVSNISPTNPKRLDVKVPVKLGGNVNIVSLDLSYGFFYGTVEEVA